MYRSAWLITPSVVCLVAIVAYLRLVQKPFVDQVAYVSHLATDFDSAGQGTACVESVDGGPRDFEEVGQFRGGVDKWRRG